MAMTNTAGRHARAQAYVDSLRKGPKRRYAQRLLRYLASGADIETFGVQAGTHPERRELSFMAAQAVEMRLRAIWRD